MKTMKTSNIIISAFVIFLIGGMLILSIDAKHHKITFEKSIISKEIALPQFSVVVAEKGAYIQIHQSDSTKLSFRYLKGQMLPSKLYKISNDTLYVYCHFNTFPAVLKCKNIKSIIGHNQFSLNIFKFIPDSLTINMTGGITHFNNGDLKGMKLIEKSIALNITATKEASIDFKNMNISKLNIISNNSQIDISTNISLDYLKKNPISNEIQFWSKRKSKYIIASLKNNSYFHISNNPLKINIDCDSTSNFIIGNVNYYD